MFHRQSETTRLRRQKLDELHQEMIRCVVYKRPQLIAFNRQPPLFLGVICTCRGTFAYFSLT